MKILSLETSTNACSVALIDGTKTDYSSIERFEIAPRMHTELILPMLDSVLDEAALDIQEIDVLAYGRGPGAFTGVRVGTGVIQALSYGADIPVAQISSLAAIAQRVHLQQPLQALKILVASDARMKEIYFAAYEAVDGFMQNKGIESVLKPENLPSFLAQQAIEPDKNYLMVGSGWSEYALELAEISAQCHFSEDSLAEKNTYPHAREIAYLAFKEVELQNLVSAEQISPVYLRNNVAKKKAENKINT